MGRLIDAEECPCYMCGATCPYTNPIGDCRKFNNWIRKPAYDVDKVVIELWEQSFNDVDEGIYDNGYTFISTSDAISIVRKGGM